MVSQTAVYSNSHFSRQLSSPMRSPHVQYSVNMVTESLSERRLRSTPKVGGEQCSCGGQRESHGGNPSARPCQPGGRRRSPRGLAGVRRAPSKITASFVFQLPAAKKKKKRKKCFQALALATSLFTTFCLNFSDLKNPTERRNCNLQLIHSPSRVYRIFLSEWGLAPRVKK